MHLQRRRANRHLARSPPSARVRQSAHVHEPSPVSPVRSPRGPRRRRSIAARVALGVFALLVLGSEAGATVGVAGFVALSRDLENPRALERIEFPEQSIIYDWTGETELAR